LRWLLYLIVIISSLYAQVDRIEYKIIQKIAHALTSKKTISIYTDVPKYLKHKKIDGITFTNNCQHADIALLRHFSQSCTTKPVIVLDYMLLKKQPNALGAFYWQKGRPNITFLEKHLQRNHIKLPKEFDIFIEERLY